MIKANELRIGNYVSVPLYDVLSIKKVVSINEEGIDYDNGLDAYHYGLETLIPIPLTPEILKQCNYYQYYSNRVLENTEIWKNPDTYICDLRRYIIDDYPPYFLHERTGKIEIKYLHQFQNLYFALTGEELKVNLTASVSL